MTKSGRDFPGAFISLLNTYTSPFPPEVWSSSHASSCPSRDRIHSGCNVWRMERALYPALPPGESARPGAALHRTRGNARGGGPWQPWANCRGRPALRPCRLCPAARVGLTSTPGSHTHCAIRKTRGSYGESQASKLLSRNTQVPKQGEPNPLACLLAWRKSIWRRECRRTSAHLRSRPDSSGNIHRLSSCWSSCSA